MLTFNRHIYQSANRSSERRLGPVGFPNLSEFPVLLIARVRIEKKITTMKKLALMVKSVIAWFTTNDSNAINASLITVRVKSQGNSLNLTNKR